ncbi:MAG: polysaccharide deacetylase [Acidimicrobiia bacterium]|nr:polysaccharide deacetylase [Acidimicrobiia bacterium]
MSTPDRRGVFTISLDFELHWGVRDGRSLASYRENLLKVHDVVPRLLALFEQYEVHCTWATVGFLFFDSVDDLKRSLPARRPAYVNGALDPYRALDTIGPTADGDPLHFAPRLIRAIQATPHQEVGTHTFSHYYCLEPGQTLDTFRDDLQAAIDVARRTGIELTSLVFPRNQFNDRYLDVLAELGLTAYRGNARSWLYAARTQGEETLLRRGCRLLDNYVRVSGFQVHRPADLNGGGLVDIPASRFLRPYQPTLAAFEPLRLRRIRDELTHAARTGGLYHLWWHPHNFGSHTEENFAFLRRVLDHYTALRARDGMISLNMGELARDVTAGRVR